MCIHLASFHVVQCLYINWNNGTYGLMYFKYHVLDNLHSAPISFVCVYMYNIYINILFCISDQSTCQS